MITTNEHAVRFVTFGKEDWSCPVYADGSHIDDYAKAQGLAQYRVVHHETLSKGVVFVIIKEVEPVVQALDRMKETILRYGKKPQLKEDLAISEAIERYIEEVNKPLKAENAHNKEMIDKLVEQAQENAKDEARLRALIRKYKEFIDALQEEAKLNRVSGSLVVKIDVFKHVVLNNQE